MEEGVKFHHFYFAKLKFGGRFSWFYCHFCDLVEGRA